ncbi:MAG: Ig-like domain-containing protein [Candidatus Thiodiazotropha sp.]
MRFCLLFVWLVPALILLPGCKPACDDGVCELGETCETCPQDCGQCEQDPVCDDGVCDLDETCETCPQDCGQCEQHPVCDDGVCESGESCDSCPQDCGVCPSLSVSITAPVSGDVVSGPVTVTADATDTTGVAGVQFQLDGIYLAAEQRNFPYEIVWDTTTIGNGDHTLSAIARNVVGDLELSNEVQVTVENTTPSDGFPPDDLGPARGGLVSSVADGMGVGIGVNPGDVSTYADEIQNAGFTWVRSRLLWKAIETTPGVYNWTVAPNYDRIANEFNNRGIGVLFMVTYHNDTAYSGLSGNPPFNATGRRNFGNFLKAAAAHFKGRKIMFEIGNEPNIKQFWPVDANNNGSVTMTEVRDAARAYAELAKVAIPMAKSADGDPDAFIIGPSLANRGGPYIGGEVGAHVYIQELKAAGALEPLFDRISIHLYTAEGSFPQQNMPDGQAPEDAHIELFRDLIADPNANMINTEHGWKSDGSALQDQLQASFNIRDFIYGLSQGVRMRFWFLWSHSSGMTDWFIAGTPAADATRILDRELGDFHMLRRVPSANPEHYVFEFADTAGNRRLCAWKANTSTPDVFTYPSTADATVVNLYGNEESVSSNGTSISLNLEIHPVYVRLP